MATEKSLRSVASSCTTPDETPGSPFLSASSFTSYISSPSNSNCLPKCLVKGLNFVALVMIVAKVKYFPLFLDDNGLSTSEIGIVMGVGSIAQLVGTPLWGYLSDITKRPAFILGLALASWAILLQFFQFKWLLSFPLAAVIMYTIIMLFEGGVSLVDVVSMRAVKRLGGSYGAQRWLGSLGFGLGCLIAGITVEAFGYLGMFIWSLVLGLVTILTAFALDWSVAALDKRQAILPQDHERSAGVLSALKLAYRNKAFITLLGGAIIYGTVLCLIEVIFVLQVQQDYNVSKSFVGLLTLVGTISEIPVFYFSHRIQRKLGRLRCMLYAHAAMGLRLMMLTAMSTYFPKQKRHGTLLSVVILGSQSLHGFTLVPYWTAAVESAFQMAPKHLKGAYLGLLSMAFYPLAFAFGSAVWGLVLDLKGGAVTYTCGACWTAISSLYIATVFDKASSVRKTSSLSSEA